MQEALDAGGRVFACPGRYIGNFTFTTNGALIGAGEGQNPSGNSILDANLNGQVVAVNGNVTAELQGIRITGGVSGAIEGGGIGNTGSLTVTACTITGNSASNGGGVAQHSGATGRLELNDCTIADNDATNGNGGGLIHRDGQHQTTLNDCSVSGNESSADGGGIAVIGGDVIVNGSDIIENTAGDEGGGVFLFSGDLTLDDDSSITGNNAEAGGGIFNIGGDVILNDADVSGNDPDDCVGVVCP